MPEEQRVMNLRTGESVTVELPTPQEGYLAGLRRELAMCTARRLSDRLPGIKAEIARVEKLLGVAPAPSDVERATAAPGEKRRGRPPGRPKRGD